MDTFSPKERAVNFSKLEKDRFQSLIEKYKGILFSKKTDNISIVKKNKTWAAIHAEFNAGGDHPRTLRQLKAKFDNMKRNARKDASIERQSRIRTGGGPPAPPVHPETEWFRSVMPISMDGLPSVVDDDLIENQPVNLNFKDSQEVINFNKNIEENSIKSDGHKENTDLNENINYSVSGTSHNIISDIVFDSKSPASLLRIPVSNPLRIRKRLDVNKSCRDLKCEILLKTKEQDEYLHNLKIKHMEEKRREEKELYDLKKKKLMLEISLLENKSN